jgi:DNA-binding MarR family transcriptional regulator
MLSQQDRSKPATDLGESVLDLYSDLCTALIAGQRDAWVFVDLTMPQIKALYLTVIWGSATGSELAKGLGVGLPSVTRLVDRLIERGLVAREEDPRDRRVSQTVPTPAGKRVIENLVNYKREYLGAALRNLNSAQLKEVQKGLTHLVAVCQRMADEGIELERSV